MTESDGKVKGYVDSIYCGSGVDGDGLRVVVFFCGCNLRCGFCHNPETLFKKGREVTVDEVVQRCLRYRGYIRRGGVTLSGGEPFLQKAFCLALISELKRENVNVAIETNGKITDEDLIKAADSFIVDVKNQETDDLSTYEEFLSVCERENKSVTLTNVLIPEVNGDKTTELKTLKDAHVCVKRIKFLPFHKMCEEKYDAIGQPFLYKKYREAENEDLDKAYDSVK